MLALSGLFPHCWERKGPVEKHLNNVQVQQYRRIRPHKYGVKPLSGNKSIVT